MNSRAAATFDVKNWDEKSLNESPGAPKLTHAKVTKSFRGDIEGESEVEYLMMHRADKTAAFVGFERISGKIGHRAGSFVLQHTGVFDGKTAKGDVSVVPDSSSGDLQGLQAEGSFTAEMGPKGSMVLEYRLV